MNPETKHAFETNFLNKMFVKYFRSRHTWVWGVGVVTYSRFYGSKLPSETWRLRGKTLFKMAAEIRIDEIFGRTQVEILEGITSIGHLLWNLSLHLH